MTNNVFSILEQRSKEVEAFVPEKEQVIEKLMSQGYSRECAEKAIEMCNKKNA